MAEIRLVCPGCAAEYRVPDTAIPPEGREVECSACGNVWLATAQPLPMAPAADEAPRLNRRLPDTVLDILRDEVEHERRAREAKKPAATETHDPTALPRLSPDPEWPATTITRHLDPPRPADPETAPAQGEPAPSAANVPRPPAEPAPAAPVAAVAWEPAKIALPQPDLPAAAAPVPPPDSSSAPADRPVRSGYRAGFGLAAMLAAACVALYLLAPVLAGEGGFGDGLMQLRDHVDEARLWLQDRAAILTR